METFTLHNESNYIRLGNRPDFYIVNVLQEQGIVMGLYALSCPGSAVLTTNKPKFSESMRIQRSK